MKTKLLIVLLLIIFSKISFQNTIVIDPYTYNFTLNNFAPGSSIEVIFKNPNIIGGEKDVYLYQYPLMDESDATLFSGASILSSASSDQTNFGKFSFNVDADILGYGIVVYDGPDTLLGHPCGNYTFHLSDDECDIPQNTVGTPGLSLDISNKDAIAFEILSLDHAFGNNLMFRVWDNDGGSGYFSVNYYTAVTIETPKPIIYIPFDSFTNAELINWSNIRAIAVEFNTTMAAVDLILSSFQFISYEIEKKFNSPNDLSVSNVAPFQIKITPDVFFSFNPSKNNPITYEFNVTDTLPYPFSNVDISSLQVKDENGNNLNFTVLSNSTNQFSLQISYSNYSAPIITYNATTNSTFDFCSRTFCNNVTVNGRTFVPDNLFQEESFRERNASSCFKLYSSPSLNSSYLNCPTNFSQSTLQYLSQVCNIGNGPATNVVFTHTSSGALVNCTPIFPNGSCNGSSCSSNLGDIPAGECVNVSLSFDCSVYSSECLIETFTSSFKASENCTGSITSSSCAFSSNPSLQVKVSESLLNVAPARISENITWSINATNNGPATVKSFILQKTYPQYTYPTSQTLSNWSCGANNLCTYNGASLSSGQTISNILFSVQLLNNTPIGTSQVCNNLTMISQPNQTNCFSQDSTSNCAPVNPGIPDIQIEKGVFASQYSFTIDYQNAGSGSINNLELQEVLQVGWKLNSALSTNGWKCGDSLCTFTIPSVAPSESGKVFFVVDVEESSQTDSQGMKKCWENLVSSTFDDESFDPTPLNNQASAQIGSSCKECCDPAPCPTNVCNLTCPPPTVTVPCPVVTCSCKLPEYFCPPCQVNPPTCNCNQCSQTP